MRILVQIPRRNFTLSLKKQKFKDCKANEISARHRVNVKRNALRDFQRAVN